MGLSRVTDGYGNSPAIACRLGNSGIRKLRDGNPLFEGQVIENTWRRNLDGQGYVKGIGHGRVEIGQDGLPVAKLWSMVDDFLVHGSTKAQTGRAFGEFMDHSVRLGFICQPIKTSPPAQRQKFCGMIYDTTSVPRMVIPDAKVSRGIATIDFLERTNTQQRLSRLSVAVGGGFLQSLVDATPSRIGQTYLRSLYDEVHDVEDLHGKELYYTSIILSEACMEDLAWWKHFLLNNPGNFSRNGTAGNIMGTWGDGSGTGTGGTVEPLGQTGLPTLEAWMGAWNPWVYRFSSNWKELQTLLWTLERLEDSDEHHLHGVTLFYFTDNMTTYYVVWYGDPLGNSSPSATIVTQHPSDVGPVAVFSPSAQR
jgi:hypothetical protein